MTRNLYLHLKNPDILLKIKSANLYSSLILCLGSRIRYKLETDTDLQFYRQS